MREIVRWELKKSVFLIVSLFSLNASAQLIDSVYDSQLNRIPLAEIENGGNFLLINSINCVACVEYLNESTIGDYVLLVVDNLSLVEFERLKMNYHLSDKNSYFIQKEQLKAAIENGPQIILNNNRLLSYQHVSVLSKDYTMPIRKFNRLIRQHVLHEM